MNRVARANDIQADNMWRNMHEGKTVREDVGKQDNITRPTCDQRLLSKAR